MKVFHEKDYKYVGLMGGKWHCFLSIKENFDPEMVLVYRAKMIRNDGSSVYYDPVSSEAAESIHFVEYNNRRDKVLTSMCVIDPAKVKRKPKWRVAESDDSVRFVKVSPEA